MTPNTAHTAQLPPTEVFYAGTHTDARGRKITLTREDLAATVAAYDPAVFAAPLVIGHPTMDAPAFGWINKLALNDANRLVSEDPTDVHPEFAALVESKRFPKVSISFFAPTSPHNPKPGVWYPRHLGYLGAAAPALPGLKVANFAADESDVVTFGGYDDMSVANLFRSLKNFLLTKFTGDAAAIAEALPEYTLNDLQLSAATEIAEDSAKAGSTYPNFSAADDPALTSKDDHMSAELLKKAQDDLAAANKVAADATAALAKSQAAQRSVEFAAQADALIKEGRLHPDERDNYVAFMAQPEGDLTVEFSAPDGTEKSFSAREFLANFIKRRAPLVEMKEIGKGKVDAGAKVVDFAAPPGMGVDPESAHRHNQIEEYSRANKVSYIDAARALGF